jgi:hypothetical protein
LENFLFLNNAIAFNFLVDCFAIPINGDRHFQT